jgi:hypothetical protein
MRDSTDTARALGCGGDESDDVKHVKALQKALRVCQGILTISGPGFRPDEFLEDPEEFARLPAAQALQHQDGLYAAARHLVQLPKYQPPRVPAENAADESCQTPSPTWCYPFDIGRLEPFSQERPIFILGGPRAGTTALTNALRASANYSGWAEGHLFSVLPQILMNIKKAWENVLRFEPSADIRKLYALGSLDVHAVMNGAVAACHRVYADAAAANGNTRWIDKSPNCWSTLVVPLLRQIYPNACFVFLHRHPLKNILSFSRKYPHTSIEFAAVFWLLSLRAWTSVRPCLEGIGYLELEQADLSLRTESAVSKLVELLELTPQQAVALQTGMRAARPEYTGAVSDAAEVYLDTMDWPQVFKAWFRDFAEDSARAWGYRICRDGAA